MRDSSSGLSEDDWALLRRAETRQAFYERAASVLVSHGGEHWCCRYPDLVRELLWLWQYGNQPTVKWIQSRLEEQLGQGCFPCVLAYRSSREDAVQGLDAEKFRDAVDAWDASRLERKLSSLYLRVRELRFKQNAEWHESLDIQQLLCSLLEVLIRPKLLALCGLNEPFTSCLLELLHPNLGGEGLTISAGRWLAGVYYLCGHSHERVRSWAREQVAALGVIEDAPRLAELEGVIEDYLAVLADLTAADAADAPSDVGDAASGMVNQPKGHFSKHPREVWMGLLAVVRKVHPRLLEGGLLPRFPSLLTLASLALLSGGPALFPALQTLHQMLTSLGRALWPLCPPGCSPTMLWTALEGHVLGGPTVPVQKAALEALPALLDALNGHLSDSDYLARSAHLMEFLCGPRLRTATRVPAVTHDIATLVAVRFLHATLRRGGFSALPLHCARLWAPHVVVAATAPGVSAAVRTPAAEFIADALAGQAALLEDALLRAQACSAGKPPPMREEKALPVAAGAAVDVAPEEVGRSELKDGSDGGGGGLLCESLWGLMVMHVGAAKLPVNVHEQLLSACAALLFWNSAWPALYSASAVGSGGDDGCNEQRLHDTARAYARFVHLSLLYFSQLSADPKIAVDVLGQSDPALQAAVGLLWTAHPAAREAGASIILHGIGSGGSGGASQALDLARARNPLRVGAALEAACRRILDAGRIDTGVRIATEDDAEVKCGADGLDGPAFACLPYLFLFAGQIAPAMLSTPSPLTKRLRWVLRSVFWELAEAFVRARLRLRRPEFDRQHGPAALDAAAARFFPFLRALWPFLQKHREILSGDSEGDESDDMSDDDDGDEENGRSVVVRHGEWLPSLAKWGGVASLAVRRHWCDCCVAILESIRTTHSGSGADQLTSREKRVFEKLLGQRELWTDGQLLALGRALGPLGLVKSNTVDATASEQPVGVAGYGNLGVDTLIGLPNRARSLSSPEGVKHRKRNKLSKSSASSAAAPPDSDDEPLWKKRRHTSNELDKQHQPAKKRRPQPESARTNSMAREGCEVTRQRTDESRPRRRPPKGTAQDGPSDAADKRAGAGGLAALTAAALNTVGMNCVTVKIGGVEIQVPILARRGVDSSGAPLEPSRPVKTAAELEDEMHRIVLGWDIAAGSEAHHSLGAVTSAQLKELPIRFSNVDEYEDLLGPLLLKECLEQVAAAFQEHCPSSEPDSTTGMEFRVQDSSECGLWTFARLEPPGGLNADFAPVEGDLVALVWDPEPSDRQQRPTVNRRATGASSWTRSGPNAGDDGQTRLCALALVERRGRDRRLPLKLFLHGDRRLDMLRKRLHIAASAVNTRNVPAIKSIVGTENNGGGDGGRWKVVVLHASISTAEREYVAVHTVSLSPEGGVGCGTRDSGTGRLNRAQERAIIAGQDRSAPFTLIQGPPGTGKTRTIVGLISAMLTSGQDVGGGCTVRILVCAPSNAAVDELAMRLFEGLASPGGPVERQAAHPLVVRVGSRAQMRAEVWDRMSLDRLAEREMLSDADRTKGGDKSSNADEEDNDVRSALTEHAEKLASGCCDSGLADRGSAGTSEERLGPEATAARTAAVRALCRAEKEAAASVVRRREQLQAARARVLSRARVVCSTLSGAGSAAVRSGVGGASLFDAVVIDEAAQAVEASALVPLPLLVGGVGNSCGRLKCVLVGDPQQLPATVISRAAAERGYGRSLFERLQAAGQEAVLLSEQYRMHPAIRSFPSDYFYGGRLTDGVNTAGMQPSEDRAKWPWHRDIRFGPVVVYDIPTAERRSAAGSVSNAGEAFCCALLLRALAAYMGSGGPQDLCKRAAVLTPYRKQVHTIRESLASLLVPSVEVSTIDSFQGREADIIILSCVRGFSSSGIGFVADMRRMNVALTRARGSLIVLCNATSLCQNEHWRAFLDHARNTRSCVYVPDGKGECIFGSDQNPEQWHRDEWPDDALSVDTRRNASEGIAHPKVSGGNRSKSTQKSDVLQLSSNTSSRDTSQQDRRKDVIVENADRPPSRRKAQADKNPHPDAMQPANDHQELETAAASHSDPHIGQQHDAKKLSMKGTEPDGVGSQRSRVRDSPNQRLDNSKDRTRGVHPPEIGHQTPGAQGGSVTVQVQPNVGARGSVKAASRTAGDKQVQGAPIQMLRGNERGGTTTHHPHGRGSSSERAEQVRDKSKKRTGSSQMTPPSAGSSARGAATPVPTVPAAASAGTSTMVGSGSRTDKPAGTAADDGEANQAIHDAWSKHWSNTWGKHYFFNARTGEQRWEPPQLQQQSRASEEGGGGTGRTVQGGGGGVTAPEGEPVTVARRRADSDAYRGGIGKDRLPPVPKKAMLNSAAAACNGSGGDQGQ